MTHAPLPHAPLRRLRVAANLMIHAPLRRLRVAANLMTNREHLLQGYFPLPQADADQRQVFLVINAHDAAGLVEAGDAHQIVWLQLAAGFAQSRIFLRLPLQLLRLLPVFLALLFGLVLRLDRLGASFLGLLTQLLQAGQLRARR